MSRPILSVAFVVCGILASSACASQAEGERCDPLSGNDDCESGLQCTPASQLAIGANQTNASWGLCCPFSGDTSRVPVEACFAATSTPGAGGSSGAGGATGGTAGADSGSQTGGSAGTDSGSATGGSVGSGGTTPKDAASEAKD